MWALPQSEVRSDDQVGNSRCLDRFGRRLSCFEMEEQVRNRRGQANIHHVAQFSRLVFQNLQIGTPFDEILSLLDSIGSSGRVRVKTKEYDMSAHTAEEESEIGPRPRKIGKPLTCLM